MLDGRSKWQRQPTQPMEWDEKNPLAERLVSLAALIQGRWIECGPHGSCAPLVRAGTNTVTYKAPAPFIGGGHRSDALQMATQDTAVGSGYYFDYGRNIIATSVEAVSAFALGYCNVANTTAKTLAAWGDTSQFAFTLRYGDGASFNARLFYFLQTGTDAYRGMAVNTAGIVDFMSASKNIAGAAPIAYANGALSVGASVNGTGALSAAVSRLAIGQSVALTANGTDGGACLVGAYDRELSAEEHLALAENPWQLLRPRTARIYSFPSPVTTPIISSTDNTNKWIDDTTLIITGTGFTGATNVYVTQGGTDSELTIGSITGDTTITITTPSVQSTQATYGAATIKVVGPGGTSTDFAITIEKNAAHQQVTLAGHTTGTGWATDLASANGDTLVAPLTQSGSTIVLGADGAISFTPALTNGTLVYRAWYDVGTKTWAEDQVTITDGAGSGAGLTLTLELRI